MTASHDEYTRRILDAIDAGRPVSQRLLASEMGVALGLTNLLIRRLVKRGFVQVRKIRPNRVHYLITPAGVAEKARMTRQFFENTIQLYTETREQIRANLLALSAAWPDDGDHGEKRVVFYGAGEVAEIAYVGLQATDLRLVGVVDDFVRTPFFGLPVHAPDAIADGCLDGEPFARIVIMSFRKAEPMVAKLCDLGVPPERVYLLRNVTRDGEPARDEVAV